MLAVVGDIHGSIKSFKELYYKITDKYFIHRFIILGDVIDRGLSSKETVDFLIEMQDKTLLTCLRGNHEDLMINFVENEGRYPDFQWHERVGLSTVASFMGISPEEASAKSRCEITPYFKPYMEFFKNTHEYCIERTYKHNFLFSHAGPAYFDLPPDKQYGGCSPEEKRRHYPFLWHRKVKSFQTPYCDYIIVHGHDALVNKYSAPEECSGVEPHIHKSSSGHIISVNIDTGCVYGGKLTAMLIDEQGNMAFESVRCGD